MGQNHTC